MQFCRIAVSFRKFRYMDVVIFAQNLLNDFVCAKVFVVFAAVIDSLL